jgi:hypothetical protein
MIVARQFIAWNRWENGNRPGGYGVIGSDRRATLRTINQPGLGIRPCPCGTDSRLDAFQAINCLATIISPFGTTNRRPCPRPCPHFRSHIRVTEYWSVGVLGQVPIPPSYATYKGVLASLFGAIEPEMFPPDIWRIELRNFTMKLLHHGMAPILGGCLLLTGIPNAFAYQVTTPASQPAPQAVQQSPEQLRQLVAPIALYPDPLVGQILAAATYPDEVMEADKWMQQHQGLTGGALAKEVDKQSWDPSVKALTQFPAVLANMSQNLAWTSELGDAYVNQQQDLTQTIQSMRHLAKDAGNLRPTSQENVTTDGDTIDIEPVSTDEVYVPEYDPWDVYGDALPVFPGWAPYPGLYLYGPGIGFELGFGIGLFGGYGWGWNHWGCDWHHGAIEYNHHAFVSHSRTIVDRTGRHSTVNNFHGTRMNGNHFAHPNGRSFAGHAAAHTTHSLHASARTHSSAHVFFHGGGGHGGGGHGGGSHAGGFHGGGGHGGHGR